MCVSIDGSPSTSRDGKHYLPHQCRLALKIIKRDKVILSNTGGACVQFEFSEIVWLYNHTCITNRSERTSHYKSGILKTSVKTSPANIFELSVILLWHAKFELCCETNHKAYRLRLLKEANNSSTNICSNHGNTWHNLFLANMISIHTLIVLDLRFSYWFLNIGFLWSVILIIHAHCTCSCLH